MAQVGHSRYANRMIILESDTFSDDLDTDGRHKWARIWCLQLAKWILVGGAVSTWLRTIQVCLPISASLRAKGVRFARNVD